MYKVDQSDVNNYVELLNHYEVHVSNHNQPIIVAAHHIYEACDKVNRLIKTWDTSESHEIVQVSLVIGSILC